DEQLALTRAPSVVEGRVVADDAAGGGAGVAPKHDDRAALLAPDHVVLDDGAGRGAAAVEDDPVALGVAASLAAAPRIVLVVPDHVAADDIALATDPEADGAAPRMGRVVVKTTRLDEEAPGIGR